MELEIMTIPVTLYLFIVQVQIATAPAITSDGKLQDIAQAEIETLLKDTKNLEIVNEILQLAATDPVKAREKMQEYSKTLLSKEARWILKQLVEVPEKICFFLKPVVVEIHKKLEQESYVYRVFGNIGLNAVEGLGYLGLTSVGFSLRTLGDLTQVINHFVPDSATAFKGKTPYPKTFNIIHSVAETAKKFGDRFENGGKTGLYNMARRRYFERDHFDPSKHPSVQLSKNGNGAR